MFLIASVTNNHHPLYLVKIKELSNNGAISNPQLQEMMRFCFGKEWSEFQDNAMKFHTKIEAEGFLLKNKKVLGRCWIEEI